MRFGATTLSTPQGGGAVTIVQLGGSNFAVLNASSSLSVNAAAETILNTMNIPRVFGASIVGTAGAGNKAIAELNNPAASGRNLWVYSLDFFVPVTMAVNLFLAGTSLAPAGTGFNLQSGGAAGVAKVGGGNQLTPTGSLIYTSPTLTANVDYTIPLQWLCSIVPGSNLQLQGQTVNQAFTCNVRWVEI
jgi:hypothetical protein